MGKTSGRSAGTRTKPRRADGAATAPKATQPRGNAAAQEALRAKGGATQPYSSTYGGRRTGAFAVDAGQLTFDAEGTEGGRFHSRVAHVPPGASGVTIGRGYDLGQHGAETIRAQLVAAGLSEPDAGKFARAAGLKGDAARRWLRKHRSTLPEITPEQQEALFGTTYAEMSDDVERIAGKESVEEKYGNTELDTMNPAIRDTLIDLRYRGDYTDSARQKIQDEVADNDLLGMTDAMTNRKNWKKVPKDRFERRAAYLREREELEEGAAYGWLGMPMEPSAAQPFFGPGKAPPTKAKRGAGGG